MISARIQATKPPAKPIPIPAAAQMAARWKLRNIMPSAAPRNNPTNPITTGKTSDIADLEPFRPVIDQRFDDHPGHETAKTACQAQVEIAGEKQTDEERRRL